jgi:GDPmannose 4,6-dehydratase
MFLDLADTDAVADHMRTFTYTEIYNLAARASSAQLFDDPLTTADVNGVAVARILEAIRRYSPTTRFCQASSSEVFAGSAESPQSETTMRAPLSAYGAAKAFADHLVAAYRSTHGLHASCAILFSHESPRRAKHFLVRKITHAAACVAQGRQDHVAVGDLDSIRDWGFAGDYMKGMWQIVQSPNPDDFILATGEGHTVREVCETAFSYVGLDWLEHVRVDPALSRLRDPVPRIGDSRKAQKLLGWAPDMHFTDIIHHMVDADLGQRNN